MRAVLPSVNYADFLSFILPYWLKVLPTDSLTVVTSLEDAETVAVAKEFDVPCLQTNVWFEQRAVDNKKDGPVVFNKAAALDLALGLVDGYRPAPAIGERCLSIDCDVVPFGKLKPEWELLPDTLYGCPRYQCETFEQFERYLLGDGAQLPLILPRLRGDKNGRYAIAGKEAPERTAEACLGYFQLFRYQKGIEFGNFKTAGGYDVEFKRHFKRRMCHKGIHVLHLGEQHRANWKGRVVKGWTCDTPPTDQT